MTFQKQVTPITKTDIESGLDFVLSHFNQERLFSRTIMTKKLGYQKEIFSKTEILEHFTQSKFLDCRINSFPFYTEYKGIQRYSPDLIFIDLDRNNFETDIGFESALSITLRNIKKKLGNDTRSTILETGGGYHIILPISCPMPLENITEFQEFDRPSEQFLRFAKDFLSNGKADKQNNPSFKSCLLRIPGSINSKYDKQVRVIQKWNNYRPNLSLELLLDFKRYLKQKYRQKQLLLNSVRNRSNDNNYDQKYYTWIEHLIQTPISDYRKLVIDLILVPYFMLVKKLSNEEIFENTNEWLGKCNSIRTLDFDARSRINAAIQNTLKKQIPPMKYTTMKNNYQYLYSLIIQNNNNNKKTGSRNVQNKNIL